MIRLPKPARQALLAGVKAAIDGVVESTAKDSDGGRKITKAEAKEIAQAVANAALKALADHTEAR